jgi:MFS family permease
MKKVRSNGDDRSGQRGAAERSGRGAGDRSGRRGRGVAVAALCLVQFVDVLGVTVVVTALPSMLAGLGAPPSSAALVVTGYAMCFGGLLMLGARLGDRYGHRRVLLIGLASFGIASFIAATAPALPALVAGRCLQGAAAALSVPTALRLLLDAAPSGDARRRALAAWSAAGAAAGASGFLLGGILTELADWRIVFWINLPLAGLLAVAVRAAAPRPPTNWTGRLDLAGAATLTTGVMAVVYGTSLFEQAGRVALGMLALGLGVALLAAFVAVERRAADPLLPPAALRHAHLRAGAAASALNTATTSSAMTLATLYVQDVRGASPAAAGLLLLPFSACVVVGSTAAAPLLRARSARTGVATGLTIIAAGFAILLALPAVAWLLPVGVAVAGAGLGVSSVAANSLGMSVAPALQGTASGVLNTASQLGTALGVSALLLVATASEGSDLPLAGRPLAWASCVGLALAAAYALRGRSAAPPGAGTGSAAPIRRGSGGPTLPLEAVSTQTDRGAARTTGDQGVTGWAVAPGREAESR